MPFHLLRRLLTILMLALQMGFSYWTHFWLSYFYSEKTLKLKRVQLNRLQAIRVKRTAISIKGVLIKLGQFLSARVDILPEEFCRELAQLQDAVPPADFGSIRKRLTEELGKDPDRVFANFNPEPIAAASLGQVHEATLKSGLRVAVKVQYPGIRKIVEMDLMIARWAVWILALWKRRIRWDILYREFSQILHHELDYVQESRNAVLFRKNFEDDDRIIVPRIIEEFTTPYVLTLEFIEGIKITNLEEIQKNHISLSELARLLVESYMIQIFKHHLLHGDPHPGNLSVQPGPKLIFYDFGLMQPLTPKMRDGIRTTVGGIIDRDIPRIMRGVTTLGFIAPHGDTAPIEEVAAFFIEKYRDISPKVFQEVGLEDITEDMGQLMSISTAIQIPNNFILIWRTAGMLNGIASQLDTDLNIIDLAKPYALPFIMEEGFISQLLLRGKAASQSLLNLPELLEEFLDKANRGEFKTKMTSEDVTGAISRLYRLAFRSVLGGFAIVFWVGSLILQQVGYSVQSQIAIGASVLTVVFFLISFLRKSGP